MSRLAQSKPLSGSAYLGSRNRNLTLGDLVLSVLDCKTFLSWIVGLKHSIQLLKSQPLGLHEVEVHESSFEGIPENEEDVEPVPNLEDVISQPEDFMLVDLRLTERWDQQRYSRTQQHRW